jgi:hypothetical protein
LKFLFDATLGQPELMAKMHPVRMSRTLPIILSREEVSRLPEPRRAPTAQHTPAGVGQTLTVAASRNRLLLGRRLTRRSFSVVVRFPEHRAINFIESRSTRHCHSAQLAPIKGKCKYEQQLHAGSEFKQLSHGTLKGTVGKNLGRDAFARAPRTKPDPPHRAALGGRMHYRIE